MKQATVKYIIDQLTALKITSGRNGESLYEMD